ncbi:MAG: N-acetylmuramoyl-L-alanine amidase [Peptococcales bacterium]|jgi:N-acetylmuramoyl-L-alanine amidase
MKIIDVRNQLAKHPSKNYSRRSLNAIKYMVIHHSATKGGDAFSFARYHVNTNDWPGVGYHYVILEDGTIQWCNDLEISSYHVKNYNNYSLGICLVGDFTTEILRVVQKEALKELVRSLLDRFNLSIDKVVGHNELNSGATKCPALDMDALREYLNAGEIEIFVNNTKLNISAELKNGLTYVPLRQLGEELGYEVKWDGDKRHVYLIKDDPQEEVQEKSKYYLSIINKIKDIVSEV